MTNKQLQTVVDHYLIALLWVMPGDDENENPGDSLSIHCDMGEGTRAKAEHDCSEFIAACDSLFAQAMQCEHYGSHPDAGSPEAAFGHDFALTRNGHGVGFWDRPELGELGDKISALCGWHNGKRTAFLENNLYVGDDGKAYFEDMQVSA